ncbi:Golgi transport complex subunit 3 [Paramarasmius palmivorus]|uniref:Conserved oligomeric Golgi complex subunit 3 n=1 Tax=Paramarasmius palmivorus TaxID=297713 RepID=A0AAW0BGS6_9AGAR
MQPVPRRPLAAATAPPPRPTLSLEEWESKAPLDDIQLSSISKIKTLSEHPPLPHRFTDSTTNPSSPRPSTPKLLGSSRPNTPRLKPPTSVGLLPKHPILTPQQFYDWYTQIERTLSHNQDSHFRSHISTLSTHLSTCDYLLHLLNTTQSSVDSMLANWSSVEESGKSLKESCERLLDERTHLLRLSDDLDARLTYFAELETATRILNKPGETLVLQHDFMYMVERVDICISYLKNHRSYRESELYLLRFGQCLTRAMTLIKMYFVGSLRAIVGDISKRLETSQTEETTRHLIYTRFLSLALGGVAGGGEGALPPLLAELELRTMNHPETLGHGALLGECHAAYVATRKSLVGGVVREQVKELMRGVEDVVELTRAGCTYIKQLCIDEYDLWNRFFSTGEDVVYNYLETLCDFLYDHLRPRILHETKLEGLCQVCTVLQGLMVDIPFYSSSSSSSASSHSDSEDDDEEPQNLKTSTLLHPLLQDAQTRLFFKAQSVVQSDIRYYVPPSSSTFSGDEEYETIKKTTWVLDQLRDYVDPAIYKDIATEALLLCLDSLHAATAGKEGLEPKVWLVKQVMALRDVVGRVGFDGDSGSTSAYEPGAWGAGGVGVGGGVADTLSLTSLLGAGVGGVGSVLASFGVLGDDTKTRAGGVEGVKRAITQSLRVACQGVIEEAAQTICAPLGTLSSSTSTTAAPNPTPNPDPEEFKSAYVETITKIRAFKETEGLVRYVRERVEDEYAVFRLKEEHKAKGEGKGEGKGEVMDEMELRVWLRSI